MSATKESKLEQVRRLLNMTVENGCTEQEAHTAFLTAQRMMQSWDIAESEVVIETEDDSCKPTDGYTNTVVKRDQWVRWLANVVGKNFRCKVWFEQ